MDMETYVVFDGVINAFSHLNTELVELLNR